MSIVDDARVMGSDELIDRAWATFLERTEHPDDPAVLDMLHHSFRAGWLSALVQLLQTQERREEADA